MKTRVLTIHAFLGILLVSCSDVNHEHNFAELIEANYKFRTPEESQLILDEIGKWVSKNGFSKQGGSDVPTIFHASLDPKEPRFYSKLFVYRDAHGSNSLNIELKTDRWGNAQDHRKQKVVTDSLRADFRNLFPGNFRIEVVVKERDGIEVTTNERIPLDDSFPGIK